MAIQEINGEMLPVDPLRGKKSQAAEKTSAVRKDKIELSEEAKTLYEADQTKRIEQIRERLDQDFYSSPEAMEKIVTGLMEDLKLSAE